jgi:DNA polymerase
MTTLWLDTETFCETPITHGTYRYAESAEVMLVAYAFDDEPVQVLDLTAGGSLGNVQMMIDSADRVVIHNSNFDRAVLRHNGVHIPLDKLEDTMARALAHSLPGSLGALCDVLGVPQDKAKDKHGKKLIHLFTKPRPRNVKLRRATRETHPEEWAAFVEYARLDVDAMRSVHGLLPRWNDSGSERRIWLLDQHVNDRGIAVDVRLAEAALRAFQRSSRSLAGRTGLLTGGAVASLTQRAKFLDHLQTLGYDTPDLTKGTVSAALKGELSPMVRELLEIRQQASATSPAKYKVLINGANSDGRLRGTLQYCGASRTGRWGGRMFQPQNLPRPTLKQADIDIGIEAMKADCEDLLFDNVSELCSSAVRGALVAAPGKKLVIADLSNIEGRVLAWLAGEQWKVKAFRDFDAGIGHDLYKLAYARSFNIDPEDVSKDQRQIGKVQELALGYQGGLGAFNTMAGAYGLSLPDERVQELVAAWRKAHPAVKSFWYDIERACMRAIDEPKTRQNVQLVAVVFADTWLRIRLPSGRQLCYPNAAFEDGRLVYDGVNQYTKKWERIETYGGKLCIAKGTPVLTDAGWLQIEHVTSAHRVWDGVEWAEHEGLANNGVKEVISAHGVWMTPDHEVLTTEGWVCASQSEGFKRAEARLPDGVVVPRLGRQKVAVDDGVRLRRAKTGGRNGDREKTKAWYCSVLRLHAETNDKCATHIAWHVAAQSIRRLAQHVGSLPFAIASSVAQLRRAGNYGLRAVATLVRRFLGGYGAGVPRGANTGARGQFARLQPRKLSLGFAQTSGAKQAQQFARRNAVGNDYRGGSIRALWDWALDAVLSRGHRIDRRGAICRSRHLTQVYDLVNCGPRNRFVVAGEDGRALIVHNCENIVQAVARDVLASGLLRAEEAGYAVCLHVHDEIIAEVPDSAEYSSDGLSALMAENPGWSLGLPLAAAGFETLRYRKD